MCILLVLVSVAMVAMEVLHLCWDTSLIHSAPQCFFYMPVRFHQDDQLYSTQCVNDRNILVLVSQCSEYANRASLSTLSSSQCQRMRSQCGHYSVCVEPWT